jgi:hypothetical protein
MYKQKKIRVLSIGTGQEHFKKIKPIEMDNYLLMYKDIFEIVMYIDMFTVDNWMKTYAQNSEEDYLRLQDYTEIVMSATDKKDLDAFEYLGQQLYDDNHEKIEKMIRSIIDERYGN